MNLSVIMLLALTVTADHKLFLFGPKKKAINFYNPRKFPWVAKELKVKKRKEEDDFHGTFVNF